MRLPKPAPLLMLSALFLNGCFWLEMGSSVSYKEHPPIEISAVFSAGNQVLITTKDPETWPRSTTLAEGCPVTRTAVGTLAVCHGKGAYVAAEKNCLKRSEDARQWNERLNLRDYPDISYLAGVAFDGEVFAAVGDKGSIFTSSDGQTWRLDAIPGRPSLRGIVHGSNSLAVYSWENIWLLHGGGPVKEVWPDATGIAAGPDIVALSYAGSRYFIQTSDRLAVSSDCLHWIDISSTICPWNGRVWFASNGRSYIAAGRFECPSNPSSFIMHSDDAVGWTAVDTSPLIQRIGKSSYLPNFRFNGACFVSGIYVIGGSFDTLAISGDGIRWTVEHQDLAPQYERLERGGGVTGSWFGIY